MSRDFLPTRREVICKSLLAAGGVSVLGSTILNPLPNAGHYFGWVHSEEDIERFGQTRDRYLASDFDGDIKDTGKNRIVRLWKVWEQAAKNLFIPHEQTIGDCVSQAMALGLETQSAVHVSRGEEYAWCGKLSTELLYILSRVEIGKGRLGSSDGSLGSWVVQAAELFGTLPRADYGRGIDVSTYNPELARELSSSRMFRPAPGVPDWLEPQLAEAKLRRAIRIDGGFDQAADFVSNGYPILVCSGIGYDTETTDEDGFLLEGLKPWHHALLLWGIDTKSKRQGGNLANSWGPRFYKQRVMHFAGCPAGCFWAHRDSIDKMLASQDCYAIIEYTGPRIRKNLQ